MSEVISTSLSIGITLDVPVTITSAGAIIAAIGAAIVDGAGPGMLVNDGLVISAGLSSIYLANGGGIENQSNGNISGVEAIDILGSGTVSNAGTIDGGFLGIYLQQGNITNQFGGRIDGGIAVNSGTVVNQGEISSGYGAEIGFQDGGALFNLGTNATISGVTGTGVIIAGAAGTIVNQGLIDTVTLLAGGLVENAGYLGAATDSYGLTGGGAFTAVQNAGIIVAASFGSEVSFTNTNAGVVSGYKNGVVLGFGGAITNAGTIFGLGGKTGIVLGSLMSPPPGLAGLVITNGGVLVNSTADALIDGRQEGVSISGSLSAYLTNRGTIIGDIGIENAGSGNLVLYDTGTITGLGGTAIDFGAGLGRLVLGAGAQINGAVIGANAGDQVIFASGAGQETLAGLSAQFVNVTNFSNTNSDIAFGAAADLAPGATLFNSATIESNGLLDSSGTIFNQGTIIGGLSLGGLYAGTAPQPIMLSNAASGIIWSGQGIAIDEVIGGTAATIINAGIISAASSGAVAISLSAQLDNLLILDPRGTIIGAVEGGFSAGDAAGSTLELAKGARTGSISGIGSSYTGFATVELAADAVWHVAASSGQILVEGGADIVIDGAAGATETVVLAGSGATISLTDAGQFAATISGFGANQAIDILALQYDVADQVTLRSGNVLEIDAQGEIFALQLDKSDNFANDRFHLASNGANATEITESAVPCFLKATPIRTPGGDVPVEALAIGDLVLGADGERLPVKWIGRRRYGPAQAGDPDIQPIRIMASALSDGVPRQDVYLSPSHAVLVDGHHIPAAGLVNGISILATTGRTEIEYFHIETEYHTSIIAAGMPVETFIDDDSRRLFDNAAEYDRLYPDRGGKPVLFGVPRLESGPRLEALRRRLASRAGAPVDSTDHKEIAGFLEFADRETVTGWAYNPTAPHTPVLLDILNRGAVIARALANLPRPDVQRAGYGQGRCGFSLRLPAPLPAFQRHEISVRPACGQSVLTGSPVVMDPGFVHDLVKVGALRQLVEAAAKSISEPQDIDALELDLARAVNTVRALRAAPKTAARPLKQSGRMILMIDEHWPTPTRDAGSNAILSHLQAFAALGYAVAFCAAAGAPRTALEAACLLQLQAMGVQCHGQDGTATEEIVKTLARRGFELAYLHRMEVAARYAGLIRHHAPTCRMIYAVADLHHIRLSRHAELTGRRDLAEKARRARATEFWTMRMADLILTHSRAEAAYLTRAAPDINVHVVPWAVAPRGPVKRRMGLPDIAFIGGADHAPNVDAVLHLAQDILPVLWAHKPALRCLIIGEGWPARIFGGLDPRLQAVGHQADLSAALGSARLTVAPLRFGAGIKGKVLESFAAGLPCVMSDMAAEGLDLDAGLRPGVAPVGAFAEALLDVYEDDEKQVAITRSGRQMLGRQFSPRAVERALSAMLC